ncbi:MAG: glycosyltransferase family 2 protein [Planctomycetes bacterium]|nr:glycosyltransferase family 2 protein [Planctomycetota bacterium]
MADNFERERQYKNEIFALRQRMSELERVVRTKDQQLGSYAKALDDVTKSTSWKITAPLRMAMNLLRGKPIFAEKNNRSAKTSGASLEVAGVNDADDSGIFYCCDRPKLDSAPIVGSTVLFEGWAVCKEQIEKVEVFVAGESFGALTTGFLRTDVYYSFPNVQGSENSGFKGYVSLETLPDGVYGVSVVISAKSGKSKVIAGSFILDRGAKMTATTPDYHAQYRQWWKVNSLTDRAIRIIEGAAKRLRVRPKISVIMPVYNTPKAYLSAAIESVLGQIYPEFELCIADDASTKKDVRQTLEKYAAGDSRIRLTRLERNSGISEASNCALALATGDYIALMDSDDLITRDALFEIARAIAEDPSLDFIYSDEDKIDESGEHYDGFFKPDWSYDLFLSMMYTCHLSAFRRSLVTELGGFRDEFKGSQDYDLTLRVCERTEKIAHIPKVLYSWRAIRGSGAVDPEAKPYAQDAAKRALEDHVRRAKIDAATLPGAAPGRYRVRRAIRGNPEVAIILPCGGKLSFLSPCIESILKTTSYPAFRIYVVDNSEADEVRSYVDSVRAESDRVSYIEFREKPFNFSAINNYAVAKVSEPIVLLLNDDVTVINEDWLEAMVEHAQRPEVGVVGAKLLFPDRSIQHAGVVMGLHKNTGHAFRLFPPGESGYFHFIDIVREYSAITFACAMMRREVYEELGGLDDVNLPVAFNDVDMCLRAKERGYKVIYTPYARLFHYESVTKKVMIGHGEVDYMKRKWANVIARDPMYNPNLTLEFEDFSITV